MNAVLHSYIFSKLAVYSTGHFFPLQIGFICRRGGKEKSREKQK